MDNIQTLHWRGRRYRTAVNSSAWVGSDRSVPCLQASATAKPKVGLTEPIGVASLLQHATAAGLGR